MQLGAGQGECIEAFKKPVPGGTGAGAQPQTAKPNGVDGKQRQGQPGARPGFRAVGQRSTSSTTRMTRVPLPASSSGSRRSR